MNRFLFGVTALALGILAAGTAQAGGPGRHEGGRGERSHGSRGRPETFARECQCKKRGIRAIGSSKGHADDHHKSGSSGQAGDQEGPPVVGRQLFSKKLPQPKQRMGRNRHAFLKSRHVSVRE